MYRLLAVVRKPRADGRRELRVIELSTFRTLGRVEPPENVMSPEISEDGTQAYFLCRFPSSILVVDTATLKIAETGTTLADVPMRLIPLKDDRPSVGLDP